MAYNKSKQVTLEKVAAMFDAEIVKQIVASEEAVKRGQRRDAADKVVYLSALKDNFLHSL